MSNINKPGIVFWIIGVLAFIWNLLGVSNYLLQAYKVEAIFEGMTEQQIALIENLPAWMTALFAIAVFTGFFGSIALLMRKKIAIQLFFISFVTATVQQLYWLFGTNVAEVFNESMPYFMPITVIIVCAFLVWYSKAQRTKGVLT